MRSLWLPRVCWVRGNRMPDKHAFLSPSSAVRWYYCPPSAHLCEQFPDQGSVYASEGTEAHRLCEYLLKTALCIPDTDPRQEMQYYCPEMQECAEEYVQYILEKVAAYRASGAEPRVFIEQRLDLRSYIPESMGTADCVILSGDTLEIIDFKYGMHKVPASSVQIRIYALGACDVFSALYDFEHVHVAIFQPRISNVDEMSMQVSELREWGEKELSPRAREAFDGVGAFSCGEWCRMCRARRNCRALAQYELELAKFDFAPPDLLTDEEISEILLRVDDLVSWASGVKEFALESALKGHAYEGFKLVEGRSVRRFTDEEAVAQRVQEAGRDPWEKKLLGVTALEKMLGKKGFSELLSDLVSRSAGKPALVPVTDKRPELHDAARDFQE